MIDGLKLRYWVALAVGCVGCSPKLTPFTSTIRSRYQLADSDLARVQFYVGISDGAWDYMSGRHAITLQYTSSAAQRGTSGTALKEHVVVTQKDFAIVDELPGIYHAAQDASEYGDIELDIGSQVILTFSPDSSGAYRLKAINETAYFRGATVNIGGTEYTIQAPQTCLLLFSEHNTLKVFRERMFAKGRRVAGIPGVEDPATPPPPPSAHPRAAPAPP